MKVLHLKLTSIDQHLAITRKDKNILFTLISRKQPKKGLKKSMVRLFVMWT